LSADEVVRVFERGFVTFSLTAGVALALTPLVTESRQIPRQRASGQFISQDNLGGHQYSRTQLPQGWSLSGHSGLKHRILTRDFGPHRFQQPVRIAPVAAQEKVDCDVMGCGIPHKAPPWIDQTVWDQRRAFCEQLFADVRKRQSLRQDQLQDLPIIPNKDLNMHACMQMLPTSNPNIVSPKP
jgi:hypothetical protein